MHQTVRDDIYVSSFEGLSLKQYKDVLAFVCNKEHIQPCTNCEGMLKVVDKVLTCGFITLKSAFMLSSPGVFYKASTARRKLLRMPLACLGVGEVKEGSYCFYLVEKQDTVDYQIFQTLLGKSLDTSGSQELKLSKEELKGLLYLAESESEKEMLKYIAVKASGLSNSKAKEVYGICDLQKHAERVDEALNHAKAIRESIEKIACLKDKGLLASFGYEVDTESDLSDTESESDPDEQMSEDREPCGHNSSSFATSLSDSLEHPSTGPDGQYQSNDRSSMQKPQEIQLGGNNDECYKHQSDTSEVYMNSHQVLDILKSCSFNWFAFVMALKSKLPDITEQALNQLLLDFGGQLSFLNLDEGDLDLAEWSRQAFLLSERKKVSMMENALSSQSLKVVIKRYGIKV